MTEIWKAVVGFEGLYEVSDLGRVRSLDRIVYAKTKLGDPLPRLQKSHIVAQQAHRNGYRLVHLYRDGRRKADTAHNLVAAAFLGPRPPGMQVAHEDGNPANVSPDNLRYKTVKANIADKRRHGTLLVGEQCHQAKLTAREVAEIRRHPNRNSGDLGAAFGVSRTCVNHIRARRTWRHV